MHADPRLYIVHCIDTEGPLTEDLVDTFARLEAIFDIRFEPSGETLRRLQRKEIDLHGIEDEVARVVSPRLLAYNNSWSDIRQMLAESLDDRFRRRVTDDFGRGWTYSWHCMDHAGYSDNPRRKDLGYGNVFRFYRQMLRESDSRFDEINWHFHPLSFSRNPLQCATSYVNSYDVLTQILCRRIIDHQWFPVTNRPGFHSERPDSHAFLEQWIPFDYANQHYEEVGDGQPDLRNGRFGDWRRAPATWCGYHPAHDDYQEEGGCRRWIFRCLNVGTRFHEVKAEHLHQAFRDAETEGSAVFAFANHDYRDIRPDVEYVRGLLKQVRRDHPKARIRFAGATEAARLHTARLAERSLEPLQLELGYDTNRITVRVVRGAVFGPQPYLALKTICGRYFHDNFDLQVPRREWTYTLDGHALPPEQVEMVAAASAGADGSVCARRIRLTDSERPRPRQANSCSG